MSETMEVTRDTIGRGRLVISQPRKGYRFNVDSVILAGFASPPGGRVCDLGTGSGIVGLWLATEGACSVTGVELQPKLAALAMANARENGLEAVFHVVEGDLRRFELAKGEPFFDQVVSNPPFSPVGRGRVDQDPGRAIARHEIHMRLGDLFDAASRLLAPGGRFDLIHRADRAAELIQGARSSGLIPRRLREVVARAGESPSRVLLEAIRPPEGEFSTETGDAVRESPLIVHEASGQYATEVARLLGD